MFSIFCLLNYVYNFLSLKLCILKYVNYIMYFRQKSMPKAWIYALSIAFGIFKSCISLLRNSTMCVKIERRMVRRGARRASRYNDTPSITFALSALIRRFADFAGVFLRCGSISALTAAAV